MSFKCKKLAACLGALSVLALPACAARGENNSGTQNGTGSNDTEVNIPSYSETDLFTDRDLNGGYASGDNAGAHVAIALSDNGSTVSGNGATVSGNTVTITQAGAYDVSGSLSDGQIVVNAQKTDKVQLILNGVSVNCSTSAAIYVKRADKVFLTLGENTQNTLSNTSDFVAIDDNNIDAVVFAKDDITLGGSGSLTINAKYGHGIACSNDIKVTGGTYTVTAKKRALSGKDSVRIAAGNLTLTAGTDGVHSENADEEDKGYVYIGGGSLDITASSDGVNAEEKLQIDGGEIAVNAKEKGIKCTGDLLVSGGKINVTSLDDCLHSNSDLSVTGGEITCSSGDDGIHADNAVSITGGKIDVIKSYEGIEGTTVAIGGGEITVTASDDGVNAAGGMDNSGFGGMDGGGWGPFPGGGWNRPGMGRAAAPDMPNTPSGSATTPSITISGGKLTVNASGDGIDSNGTITVSGGETYVSGPTDNGNGALDYDGSATITGGIFVAAGASGMAQNFGNNSTQGSVLFTRNGNSAGEIVLEDKAGNVLLSFTPQKQYNSVVVSCPAMTKGADLTITACGKTASFTLTSLIARKSL